MNAETTLHIIKSVHTMLWAFFASCVLAIPYEAWLGRFSVALVLIALVILEILILAMNSWHCPITAIAARYTNDRRGNFDIYLPQWLATRTQIIFGPLFVIGLIAATFFWSRSPA